MPGDVVRSLLPTRNSFAFFHVSYKSFHQVTHRVSCSVLWIQEADRLGILIFFVTTFVRCRCIHRVDGFPGEGSLGPRQDPFVSQRMVSRGAFEAASARDRIPARVQEVRRLSGETFSTTNLFLSSRSVFTTWNVGFTLSTTVFW